MILSETGLDALYLDLELTESVLMHHAESSATILHALKEIGVHLAVVDDFGTGYSSLSYLQQFPIDILKIDKSFIQRLTGGLDDSPIVGAIINMGKSLKLRVIAEGIETQQQLGFLQAQHCGEGQGYLFSRPVAAAQFTDLLKVGNTETLVP